LFAASVKEKIILPQKTNRPRQTNWNLANIAGFVENIRFIKKANKIIGQ
jgi:hypothetical protein